MADFNLSFIGNSKHPKGANSPHQGKEDPLKHINDLSNQLHNFSRRVRVIEEGLNNFRKKFQLSEQNLISNHKNVESEILIINSDIKEMKSEIKSVKSEIIMVIKELKLCAKTDEVKVLEKYINLWEPMNFVTHSELNKIVDEIKDILKAKL